MHMNKKKWLNSCLLVAGVLVLAIAYSNTLNAPFVFDDNVNILENPTAWVREFSFAELKKAALGVGNGRLLARLTIGLNYYMGRENTLGYHLVNIGVHFLTFCFLFLLCKKILSLPVFEDKYRKAAPWLAFFAALVWAIHPLQTQGVTYIIQRMASMAGMFMIVSLYLYILARSSDDKRKWPYFGLSGVAFVLALACKENVAVAPLLALSLEVILFQQGRLGFLYNKRVLTIFAGITAAAAGLFFWLRSKAVIDALSYLFSNKIVEKHGFTVLERLLSESRVLFFYLYQFLAPVNRNLSIEHDFQISHSLWQPPTTLFAVLGIILLLVLAFTWRKRYPFFSLAVFWFFIAHLVEGIAPQLALIYDHRMYTPSMLLPLAILSSVYGGFELFRKRFTHWRWPGPQVLMAGAGCLLVIPLGALTYERNNMWADEVEIWQDAVDKYPSLVRPRNNLAKAFFDAEKWEEARVQLEEAVSLDPDYWKAYLNLANYYLHEKDYRKADQYLVEALTIQPEDVTGLSMMALVQARRGQKDDALYFAREAVKHRILRPKVYGMLGRTMFELKRYQDAINCYEKGLELKPGLDKFKEDMGKAYVELGNELTREKETQAAVPAYQKALEYIPDNPAALSNLMVAKAMLGEVRAAIEYGEKALAIEPGHKDAVRNLAGILKGQASKFEQEGDVKTALKYYKKVIKLKPDSMVALNNAAWLLLTAPDKGLRDPPVALEMAKKAAELSGYKHPNVLETLSMALAETGHTRDAIRYAEKAVELGQKRDDFDDKEIKERLKEYRKER